MALKFLNKKGWHTGSLRNIENVWKAEQKHEAEQKKLEELRKQIHEERERSEFRLLQEQAGLVPKQERLDFLYESGLALGKGNSDGFKVLESIPKPDPDQIASSSSTKQPQSSVPGALFEDKPQSANDAWRKLHSDPLLLIKQREQEALARVKNNPIQMAMIRKSVEAKKRKEKPHSGDKHLEKSHHKNSKHQKHATSKYKDSSHSEDELYQRDFGRKKKYEDLKYKEFSSSHSDDELYQRDVGRKNKSKDLKYKEFSPSDLSDPMQKNVKLVVRGRSHVNYQRGESRLDYRVDPESANGAREDRKRRLSSSCITSDIPSRHKRQNNVNKLSEEERAARLREMQLNAELHDEQRWKRLRKAEEDDAKEATHTSMSRGRNFLDAAHKSVYGADKGGCSTIEESVRRRTHYSQRTSQEGEGNAFRR